MSGIFSILRGLLKGGDDNTPGTGPADSDETNFEQELDQQARAEPDPDPDVS